MNFEVLKRSNLKRNIIIGVVVVAIITAVVITFSRASYKSVAKIDLVDGVINYSLADFNVIAMYQQKEDSDEYEPVDEVPSSGYTLSTESNCTVNGEQVDYITITYADGEVNFTGVKKKGTKCYLYFDIGEAVSAGDTILANVTVNDDTPDFSKTATTDEGVFKATDDDGTSYYFRGAVTNNYVLFAGYYWRIIRINGDGSIRMIYAGSDPNTTGTDDQITVDGSNTFLFNWTYQDNTYVGYMTGLGNQCTSDSTCSGDTKTTSYSQATSNTYDSNIKNVLDDWYKDNILYNYSQYISTEAGFCGDRTPSTSSSSINNSGGYGTTTTYYGAYIRLTVDYEPTLKCENNDGNDLYTVEESSKGNHDLDYPIGLITADEVAMAGVVYGSSNTNTSYYLYTGQTYWTMSPYTANSYGFAVGFVVYSSGYLYNYIVISPSGVRPVINLRSDVTISSGDGSSSSPFVIAT